MTYVSSFDQGKTIRGALADNAQHPITSEKAVSTFNSALALPMTLAETTVIKLDDGGPGHAALHIDDDGTGQNFLYDPAGSYRPQSGDRSGDFFFGKDADLQRYVHYWQNKGDTANLHKLDTTSAQEQEIIERAGMVGNTSPPLCATSVSGALVRFVVLKGLYGLPCWGLSGSGGKGQAKGFMAYPPRWIGLFEHFSISGIPTVSTLLFFMRK